MTLRKKKGGGAAQEGSSTPVDEPDVLRRACAGDRVAFRVLVDRYRGPLYTFVYRMVRSAPVAEELVQETFVRVFRASSRYRPTARVSTWLFRIASRLAMNEASRARHTLETPLEEAAPDASVLRSTVPGPAETLETKELARSLEAALDRLPPNQRAAVLLARVEELSYAEIAQILEISAGAVDGLLQRARKNLTEMLASSL